jgi:hypothetical protein
VGTSRTSSGPDGSPRGASGRGRALGQTGPRLAYSKSEAAIALGISINSFERHVQPELRVVRRGKLRLFPATELERWLRENAELTLEER